jgi:hypothetical protein
MQLLCFAHRERIKKLESTRYEGGIVGSGAKWEKTPNLTVNF